MELSDYIRILRRRWWLIVLLAILTAGAAYGFSKMQEPEYKATIEMLVTSRPDFGQTQAARELRRDFAKYLKSSKRTQAVIDDLALDMDAQALLGKVKAEAATDSNVIILEVLNTNGNLAEDIARSWGNQLIFWRQQENAKQRQEDRIEVQFLDDARHGLDSPNTKVNTAAGAIFGLLIGLLLIFLLEWIESGVLRRTEDVERVMGVPVIGKIPS